MSGHSKWNNIKNRKAAVDQKRSAVFTKASREIMAAVRIGGGNVSPESNAGLRVAIDRAKEANMPKENIERLLARYAERKDNMSEYRLEGYGPGGVPMVIETETDNKNRTLAEIKLVMRNFSGNLGNSGSVLFQFERLGEIEIEEKLSEEEELKLIDMGLMDVKENLMLTSETSLASIRDELIKMAKTVLRCELVWKIVTPMVVEEGVKNQIRALVEALFESEDVINIFTGINV